MAEKDTGVLGDKQLHVGHWCVLAAENTSGILGFINKNVAQGNILSGTSKITSGGQFWATKKKKKKSSKTDGVSQLERNQSGQGAGAHGIQGVAKGMGFAQAREERAEGDFTAVYIYLVERRKEDRSRLCLEVGRDRMKVSKHFTMRDI